MASCRELVELVTEYVERALPPYLEREMFEHLSGCSDCLRYVAQMQTTTRLLAGLRSTGSSSALSEKTCRELIAAFRAGAGGDTTAS